MRFPTSDDGYVRPVDRVSRKLAQATWVAGCLSLSLALQLVHNLAGG